MNQNYESGYSDVSFIKQDETSALKFEVRVKAFPEPNPKVTELHKNENVAHVRLPLQTETLRL